MNVKGTACGGTEIDREAAHPHTGSTQSVFTPPALIVSRPSFPNYYSLISASTFYLAPIVLLLLVVLRPLTPF